MAKECKPEDATEASGGANNDNKAIGLQGHAFLMNDLIQALKEDRDPYVVPREARKAVDLILSIYESERTGKDVKVPHY